MTERTQNILLIGLFILAALSIHSVFLIMTPVPESPEMARANAEIAKLQAESAQDNQVLWRSIMAGIVAVGSGIVLTFGSVAALGLGFASALALCIFVALKLLKINQRSLYEKPHNQKSVEWFSRQNRLPGSRIHQ